MSSPWQAWLCMAACFPAPCRVVPAGGKEQRQRQSSASSQDSNDSQEPRVELAVVGPPSSLFTRPPLEDRSKYEKLQNAHDEESEEEGVTECSGVKVCQQAAPPARDPADPRHRRHRQARARRGKRHSGERETDAAKDGKPDGVFICSVSDDDSIGSASDLKARINDEYDYDLGADRGDASETISSSVYHAECESVTTHEDDLRAGEGGDPSHLLRRGPKPPRAAIRARARALQEQENRKCTQDRLLGHEYGEKPLLLDDELDSGEEESKLSDCQESSCVEELPCQQLEQPVPVRANMFPVPRPFRKTSLDESHRLREQIPEEDVFALAPFKTSLKKLNKKVFQSRSQPSSNTVSPLESSGQPIVTPPMANSSPAPGSLASPEVVEQVPEPVRLPVQADIIYEESPSEEYPIYENVLLNPNGGGAENGTTTPRYHYYENIPVPFSVSGAGEPSAVVNPSPNKNPFVNPFLGEGPAGPILTGGSQEPYVQLSSLPRVPVPGTDHSQASTPNKLTQQVGQGGMSQSLDSLSPSSTAGPVSSPSLRSTDLFGSTPFSNMTMAAPPATESKEFSPLSQTVLNGVSQFGSSQAQYFPPTPDHLPHLSVLTSTPRATKTQPQPQGKESSLADLDDADLFGAVPFKPIVQRGGGGPRSQTLPANMSSVFQAQMAQMARDDGHVDKFFGDFKVSRTHKKSTPPSFRKPRTAHQKLSDTDTSTDDEAVMANRKPKHRDRSKDRLKYKNISEEFEEENMMVLPLKQFGHLKKEKISKKNKKHEKLEKKIEKPEKSISFESAGISNMSFEDFTLEENRRDMERTRRELERSRLEAERGGDSLQSPEEDDSDLRTTGGTRFGSLKRGINPFSKLGR